MNGRVLLDEVKLLLSSFSDGVLQCHTVVCGGVVRFALCAWLSGVKAPCLTHTLLTNGTAPSAPLAGLGLPSHRGGAELREATYESPKDDIGLAPLVNDGLRVELDVLLERRILLTRVERRSGEGERLWPAVRQGAEQLIARDLAGALVCELVATVDDDAVELRSSFSGRSGNRLLGGLRIRDVCVLHHSVGVC